MSIKKLLSTAAILPLAALAQQSFAYNCGGLPTYNGGGYNAGDRVQNHGKAFQCKVAGWCSLSGAYEPGSGWAYTEAWSDLGSCDGGSSSSSSGSTSSSSGGSSSSSSGGTSNPGGVVTVYQHCNYTGWAVSFNTGDFDLNALQARGVLNDDASSVRVTPGYSVTLYQHHPFGGATITLTGDDSCLTDNNSGGVNFNDQISSMKVTQGGGGGNGGGNGSCPAWVAGTTYRAGDIVSYQGQNFVAEHENPGYDPLISTWFWEPTSQGCGGSSSSSSSSSGSTSSSSGGGGNGFVVNRQQFEQMFPNRVPFYTYDGLVTALSKYPAFSKTGSSETQRREAAAFLANIGHESGDLRYVREINQANYSHYCDWGQPYGCPAGQSAYYGKGPMQLSWNFNYKAAGDSLGIDLLNNPEWVATDPAISWMTAIWYWMTQSGPGYMTPHNAMVNNHGFGETIRSINGALECGGAGWDKVQARIERYRRFTQILGVSPGGNLEC